MIDALIVFILGALFVLLILVVIYHRAVIKTSSDLIIRLQKDNAELNQRLVGYSDVARNALDREEAFMKKPFEVILPPASMERLAECLKPYLAKPNYTN